MKIVYAGISSKYIHTMPAGWFLAEYLKSKGIDIEESYYNINMYYKNIISDLLLKEMDMLLVSVYIFNTILVKKLIKDIKAKLPKCVIVVGGPEIDAEYEYADYVIMGEGERALYTLITKGSDKKLVFEELIFNLDDIPSPYKEERLVKSINRLIYYEGSRGCPFHCSYCMASLSNGVRYFSLERVKSDLRNIVNCGAKIIKFTDRTFNANKVRTNALLQYILDEFYYEEVCFHIEVGGDLFDLSTLDILSKMPIGRIQMEAGVQSLNPKVIKATNRIFNRGKFESNITKIIEFGNIHMHLDLIAGLPYEDLESVKDSFNGVMALKPHVLQLGFLKFLKGTPIRESYNARYNEIAPYEVIDTPFISSDELFELKGIDMVIDRLYNSNKFCQSLIRIQVLFVTAYDMFLTLYKHLENEGLTKNVQEFDLYDFVLRYMNKLGIDNAMDILKFDYLVTNRSRILPPSLRKQYSAEYKKFKKNIKPSREYFYTEFSYLPNENIIGNFKVKFIYDKRNPVNMLYSYEIIC